MELKHAIIIVLFLMVLSAASLFILAGDNLKSTSNTKILINNDLTLDDMHFKIPDNYRDTESMGNSQSTDYAKYDDELDGTKVDNIQTCKFIDYKHDEIIIQVAQRANDEKIESINPSNFEQKNISDKEGFTTKSNLFGKDYYVFEYLEDGKIVKIMATDENTISQVIV